MTTTEQTAKHPGSIAPAFGDHDHPLGPQAVMPGRPDAVSHLVVAKLMGKKHWATGWVLSLCNADPRFLVHLAEQPRGYAHFLCLIYMALTNRETGHGNAADDARMLRAGNKRKLLKELFPSCPSGIVNLLHKLPKKPLQEDAYRKLMSALECDGARKVLYHAKRIKKSSIFVLNGITHFPERFRSVAMRCVKNTDDYAAFWRTIQVIEKFNFNLTDLELNWAACQESNSHGVNGWLMKKISKLPFPPPPWDGDDEMRPIRSLDELKKAAGDFKNCLTCNTLRREYAFRTVAGYGYLYVCDHIPAVVELRRDIFLGWSVYEIDGATPAQESEINMKFFRACIFPAWEKTVNRFDDDIPF